MPTAPPLLTFGDRQAAQEILTALRAKPSIVAAAIYTARGEQFARYQPDASISDPSSDPAGRLH